jgi:hypothetical protein
MPPFDRLRTFITNGMRMSHIYQPVMLKTLLERGGQASVREIAAAFLGHDQSQLEYYEAITKRMPGACPPASRSDRASRQRLCLDGRAVRGRARDLQLGRPVETFPDAIYFSNAAGQLARMVTGFSA